MKEETSLKSRPPLLSALCILTFTGSTIGFIGYFLASVFFEQVSLLIVKYSSWYSTETISPFYFTLLMVFYAFSLTGAIRMWKLHRNGFIIYIVSQLVILLIPLLWEGWNALSATNTIFTLIFSVGYGLNLKWMNRGTVKDINLFS